MPTINLVKTTDTFSNSGGTFTRDLYTGTFTDTGINAEATHRQSNWTTVGTVTVRVNNGKPSRIRRGTSDFNPGASTTQLAVAWGVPGSTATDGYCDQQYEFNPGAPNGEFAILCRHCSFASLAGVYDVSTFATEATIKWIQVDGLKYLSSSISTNFSLARPVHAYPITGTLPDWYAASPTHIAGERGNLTPFSPTEPAAGWHPNPNDPTTCQSARYINGDLCTSFFPNNLTGDGYIAANAACLYLGSSISFSPVLSERLEIFRQKVSTGMGFYWQLVMQALLPFHRGTLPNADLRIFGSFAGTLTSATIAIDAVCYPSTANVPVWSEAVVGPNTDFTRLNVALDVSGIPVSTTTILLVARLRDVIGSGVTSDVLIVRPVHMYGCNPAQSSDWPECVPGFVRRVAIP